MKFIKAFALNCLLFSLTGPAIAQQVKMNRLDLSTQALNKECQHPYKADNHSSFNRGLCLGIILGVEDNASYDKKICIPSNVTIEQRVNAINSFIQKNPSKRQVAFASNVFDALFEDWPCASK
jgi:hypothetical protein